MLPYAPAGNMMQLEPSVAAFALAATVFVGAVAGLIPGLRAARVAPMEVIRNE